MFKVKGTAGFLLICAMVAAQGQQGGFGGGGFGGSAAGAPGGRQQEYDRSTKSIESTISSYLIGEEVKNILTPGEYSEWPLSMKAEEVVIAEARSDAFDPALEVVDANGKVLATNDDRYPGDQRPLILWRCRGDGEYFLRARCFRDKAGGQVFVRINRFPSVLLDSGKPVDYRFQGSIRILLRMPMKAGQIRQIALDDAINVAYASLGTTISPIGLPNIPLERTLSNEIPNAELAPIDGDYYALMSASRVSGSSSPSVVTVSGPVVVSSEMSGFGEFPASAPGTSLWTMTLQKGDLIEAKLTNGLLGAHRLAVAELPDVSKFDVKKPETNPFFPQAKAVNAEGEDSQPFIVLPGRERDGRVSVVSGQRSTRILFASSGSSGAREVLKLAVNAAAKPLPDGAPVKGALRIGCTDYWTFEAKVGDVLSLSAGMTGFSGVLSVRGPGMNVVTERQAQVDETQIDQTLIANRPGRYIVSVSSYGHGGRGEYSLSRTVYRASDCGVGKPAVGQLEKGQVQVWKFVAKPNEPLLLKWATSKGFVVMDVHEENGSSESFDLRPMADRTAFGILKVEKPTTFLLVMTTSDRSASYVFEVKNLL